MAAHQARPPRPGPTAGSSATARRRCSSAACCRSSARSSRCPPASRGCRSGASRCLTLRWAACRGCFVLDVHRARGRTQLGAWKDSLHYVDYAVAALIVVGVVVPRRAPRRAARSRRGRADAPAPEGALPVAPRARPRRAPRARRAAAGLLLGAHRRSSPGCSAGPTRSSTASCARPSRSRCTPAPRRRCWSRCATRSARRRAGSTRRRLGRSLAGSFVPPAVVGLRARAADRGAPGHAARRSPPAWSPAPSRSASPTRVGAPSPRGARTPGRADALVLGLAQACALVPGVSRNGATLAAARLRGFRRGDASALSRHVALPDHRRARPR